jgi:glycine cleavage system H lipoate-binding protein
MKTKAAQGKAFVGKVNETVKGFQVMESQCVWMKAGVVNFKLCDRDYDCGHCSFDQVMRNAMDAQFPGKEEPGWAQFMRKKTLGSRKPCRYELNGQISPGMACARDYECEGCPVEMQMEYASVSREIQEARSYGQSDWVPLRRGSMLKRKKMPAHPSQPLKGECVWMRAGVINFKLCDGEYDCYHCAFDQSMRQAMGLSSVGAGKRPPTWGAFLRKQYDAVVSPCIHHLSGSSGAPEVCTGHFQCHRCSFHQNLKYERPAGPGQEPEYEIVSGYRIARGFHYHFGHTWVRVEESGTVRIGVDEFATRVFGAPKALQLPTRGTSLKQGEVGWGLVRNGVRAGVRSPITGKVLALNPDALEDPRLCHADSHHRGWLLMLDPAYLKMELNTLYYGDECRQWMEREHAALTESLGPRYESLLSTGSEPVADFFGSVPGMDWEGLTRRFLWTMTAG